MKKGSPADSNNQQSMELILKTLKEERKREYSHTDPRPVSYQLLITSRHYASEIINPDFLPLEFEIAPLELHLDEFIEKHCATEKEIPKVRIYLQAKLVSQVPLILTFICFLAEGEDKNSHQRDFIIRKTCDLLKNAVTQGKLSETAKYWGDSVVVKLSAQVAFEGCKEHKFEFLQKDLKELDSSLACGFLLHRNDFRSVKRNSRLTSLTNQFRSFSQLFTVVN